MHFQTLQQLTTTLSRTLCCLALCAMCMAVKMLRMQERFWSLVFWLPSFCLPYSTQAIFSSTLSWKRRDLWGWGRTCSATLFIRRWHSLILELWEIFRVQWTLLSSLISLPGKFLTYLEISLSSLSLFSTWSKSMWLSLPFQFFSWSSLGSSSDLLTW